MIHEKLTELARNPSVHTALAPSTATPNKRRASTIVWIGIWLVGVFGVFEFLGVRGDAPWTSFSEWTWSGLDKWGWWFDVIAFGVPVWLLVHFKTRGREFAWVAPLLDKMKAKRAGGDL